MSLVVLDTVLEMMCLVHKPVMHESQIVPPGRQQHSMTRVGFGHTAAVRATGTGASVCNLCESV